MDAIIRATVISRQDRQYTRKDGTPGASIRYWVLSGNGQRPVAVAAGPDLILEPGKAYDLEVSIRKPRFADSADLDVWVRKVLQPVPVGKAVA